GRGRPLCLDAAAVLQGPGVFTPSPRGAGSPPPRGDGCGRSGIWLVYTRTISHNRRGEPKAGSGIPGTPRATRGQTAHLLSGSGSVWILRRDRLIADSTALGRGTRPESTCERSPPRREISVEALSHWRGE